MHSSLLGYVGCFSKNDEKGCVYMQKRHNAAYRVKKYLSGYDSDREYMQGR
jgi:hypothetical protein